MSKKVFVRNPRQPSEVRGPFSLSELRELADRAEVSLQDQVSVDQQQWVSITKVKPSVFATATPDAANADDTAVAQDSDSQQGSASVSTNEPDRHQATSHPNEEHVGAAMLRLDARKQFIIASLSAVFAAVCVLLLIGGILESSDSTQSEPRVVFLMSHVIAPVFTIAAAVASSFFFWKARTITSRLQLEFGKLDIANIELKCDDCEKSLNWSNKSLGKLLCAHCALKRTKVERKHTEDERRKNAAKISAPAVEKVVGAPGSDGDPERLESYRRTAANATAPY
jgi:hypothetical protein